MGLLAIWLASFVKCLFKSLAHFSIGLSASYLLISSSFLFYILDVHWLCS